MRLNARSLFLAIAAIATLVNCPSTQADIVIVGLHGDGFGTSVGNGDAYAWVPLINLTAGDVYHFTDTGYFSAADSGAGAFVGPESVTSYTVPAGGLAAGALQTLPGSSGVSYQTAQANYAIFGSGPYGGGTRVIGTGDSIIVFKDDDLANIANFDPLFAVTTSTTLWSSSTVPNVDFATSTTQTNLHPLLTNGVNAVAVGQDATETNEFDNSVYTGTRTGTAAQILLAVSDADNWTGTNSRAAGTLGNTSVDYVTGGGNFTITAVPEPSSFLAVALGLSAVGFRRRR